MVSAADVERVFRQEYGRAVAVLVRVFRDIDLAEDAVQDAFAIALERWPVTGLPPSPAGWLITTARNKGIDRLRREHLRQDKYVQAILLAGQAAQQRIERAECRRARRPASAHLHLLPSGTRQHRAGRTDLAAARRPDDRRDRTRVPRPG